MSSKKALVPEYVYLRDGTKVKNHPRHNFTEKTKSRIFKVAGGVCSNPLCFKFTTGSNFEKDDYASNGEAAHICAAAPSPPAARYDPMQTEVERKSFNNGIWLCASCARIIDSNPGLYTVTLLKEWKEFSCQKSMERIGRTLLPEHASHEKNSLSDSIANAQNEWLASINHKSTSSVVQVVEKYRDSFLELDSRFEVSTVVDTKNKIIRHDVTPRADMAVAYSVVDKPGRSRFSKNLEELRRTGEGFEIDAEEIEFVGNRIFQEFKDSRPGSKFFVKTKSHSLESSLYLVCGEKKFYVCDFASSTRGGSDSMFFEGSALDGFFQYEFRLNTFTGESSIRYFSDKKSWEGKDIKVFKNLSKFLRMGVFFESCVAWEFLIECEIGSKIIKFPPGGCIDEGFSRGFRNEVESLVWFHKLSLLGSEGFVIKNVCDLLVGVDDLDFLYRCVGSGVEESSEYGKLLHDARMDQLPHELVKLIFSGVENLSFGTSKNVIVRLFGNKILFSEVSEIYEGCSPALYYQIGGDLHGYLFVSFYAESDANINYSVGRVGLLD